MNIDDLRRHNLARYIEIKCICYAFANPEKNTIPGSVDSPSFFTHFPLLVSVRFLRASLTGLFFFHLR